MDVDFQFHSWRFIIHPPQLEVKTPGMINQATRNSESIHINMSYVLQQCCNFSLGVATADIPMSHIITDMMEEEETTRAQSGQGED